MNILLAFAGTDALAVYRAGLSALPGAMIECLFLDANIALAFKHATTFSIMKAFVTLLFREKPDGRDQRDDKD
ncbi:hypothetical protein [Turneriella parva]|uniref:hypothetical protein n=1 Tax=Turneriella parva TaxID=29510 RepID=UPI0012F653AA|nr:hypothetical protein [Turneriella parva]